MSKKAPGGTATHDPSRSPDPWLDLLSEVDAELSRLRASTPKRTSDAPWALFENKPVRGHRQAAIPPATPAAPFVPPPGMAAAVAVAPKPDPASFVPTGTDLADPKNFGVMPVAEDLEMGTQNPQEFRQKLVQKIEFATRILHTSGVPAAVWREWRAWEKIAQERLRAAGG